jgi:hypothetical protein
MTTDVEICNLALDMAGAKVLIGSMTDTNASARACNRWYELTVSELFAAAQWNFGHSVQALALLKTASGGVWIGTEPPPAWIYEYAMPANAARAVFVIPQGSYASLSAVSASMGLWPAYQSLSVPFKIAKGAPFSSPAKPFGPQLLSRPWLLGFPLQSPFHLVLIVNWP